MIQETKMSEGRRCAVCMRVMTVQSRKVCERYKTKRQRTRTKHFSLVSLQSRCNVKKRLYFNSKPSFRVARGINSTICRVGPFTSPIFLTFLTLFDLFAAVSFCIYLYSTPFFAQSFVMSTTAVTQIRDNSLLSLRIIVPIMYIIYNIYEIPLCLYAIILQ